MAFHESVELVPRKKSLEPVGYVKGIWPVADAKMPGDPRDARKKGSGVARRK